jgi:nucleoside-diphosphate-sugar epimerase
MSCTIAITGTTGFIGSVLVKRLASTDCRIRALVRPASAHRQPDDFAGDIVFGDLDDMDSLERLVSGVEAIVHCAGAVRGAGKIDFDRVNVDGLSRLVQLAAKQDAPPRFLLLSSLAAREPQLSYYAASKLKGEKTLASHSNNMFWSVFRPPAIYGPGDREMLPLFQWMFRGIAPMIGSDKNRISLLCVEDLAEAIVSWLYNCQHQQRFYELHDGHPNGYSWQEIIDVVQHLRGKSITRVNIPIPFLNMIATVNLMAAKIFNGSPMLTPGKVREVIHPDWVADNKQFSDDTGWLPQLSLEAGLRRTFGSLK